MIPNTALDDALEKAGAMDASLKHRLTAMAEWHRELSPEIASAYDRLIERLASASSGAAAPAVGELMPSFLLPDHDGRLVTLKDVLRTGPAVISFNRGHWCVYCKLELRSLAQKSTEFERMGARTVSIVPETQTFTRKFKEVSDLPFTVLTDVDNGYALTLGLVVWVGEEIKYLYQGKGINLVEYQGNQSWFVPIPATFVVGQDGLIKARFVDPDFRERMEFDQIFEALRTSKG